jgi:hypothetical protein
MLMGKPQTNQIKNNANRYGVEIQVTTIRPIGQKSCDRKRMEDLIAIWVKRDNRSQYHFGATGRKISTFFFCSWFFLRGWKMQCHVGCPIKMSKRNKTKTKNFGRKKHGNSQSERK